MSTSESPDRSFGKARRIRALILKESRQIIRDPSSMAIAVVMPAILILLFGFALSLDVKNVPIAIVLEYPSLQARDVASGFQLSRYFEPRFVTSMPRAEQLMQDGDVDGIVRFRSNFASRLERGDGEVQVIVHGTDANTARIIQSYAEGVVAQWSLRQKAEGRRVTGIGPVNLQSRVWFNATGESSYFLVPGLIVLIMTLIGALLTALVVAREWERGTLEALFVTPVRADEILLGKVVPYFGLGLVGFALTVIAARISLRGTAPRFAGRADDRLDALSPGRARHRPRRIVGDEEPVRRQPGGAHLHAAAGNDALRLPVRHQEHADRAAVHHLCAAGPLLRHPVADDFPRR